MASTRSIPARPRPNRTRIRPEHRKGPPDFVPRARGRWQEVRYVAAVVERDDSNPPSGFVPNAPRRRRGARRLDSNPRHVASKAGDPEHNAKHCATLRDGGRGGGVDRDPACFTMRQDDSSRNVTEKGAECSGVEDVEAALARALDSAAMAGRFDVGAPLEARRLSRASNVVRLNARELKR
jgi:hypothetical protein